MSATQQTTIWCDSPGCVAGERVDVSGAGQARLALGYRGWTMRNGHDYCPAHR
jgi:hypothetical protein